MTAFGVTIEADGLDEVEIKADSVNLRLRHISATYIRVNISDMLAWADEIIERRNGQVRIYIDEAEYIYGNIQNIYFNRSDRKTSLSLAATRFITYSSPQARDLKDIFTLRIDDDGRHKVRCAFDKNVRPQDTVTLPGGQTFTVGFMAAHLGYNDGWLDVEGQ